MKIKVLGSGCKNCKKLLENVTEAVKNLELKAEILYVTDMVSIAASGLMRTPGLIIDEKIVSAGKVLSAEECENLLKDYLS
jgi:small redox-active disulfide protein 2